ncbi:MAG: hypothetical protein HYR88_02955 [Verrucomicrobia bacterium]|nr:hypothetical protein [Verrucomicrobiota bacterium]MBI3869662.1 hypothetical protein [Verrucomicrobiota bacterium]
MTSFLRFVGVMNAAVWLGASLFQLFAVSPFFGSAATRWLLGDAHALGAGLMLWDRFYTTHYLCLGVAWIQLLAEWVYLGRGIPPFHRWALTSLLVLGVLGHVELNRWVTPAHWNRYQPKASAESRASAERTYPLSSAVWMTTNVALDLTVLVFSLRILMAVPGPRFMTQGKFRTPDSLDP